MSQTPRFDLSHIVSGQDDAHVPHNEALEVLDTVVCLHVLSRGVDTPPAADEGDAYIVGSSPTGDWADYDAGDVAVFISDQWRRIIPPVGLRAWVGDENVGAVWSGSSWMSTTGQSILALRKSASQAISTGGTDIDWETQTRVDGIYDHDAGVDPDEIVLNESGQYMVHVDLTLDVTSSTGTVLTTMALTLNTTPVAGAAVVVPLNNTEDQKSVSMVALISASAGDILRVRATAGGASPAIQALANFCRVLVIRV